MSSKDGPRDLHDRGFKAIFAMPDAALAILRAALPRELAHAIDSAPLEPAPTALVDGELKLDHRDLLFTAKARGRRTIFCLLEHQRRVDRFMPLRILSYVVKIWDWWRARYPRARALPPVIPVVLHQGKRAWRGPRSLAELIELPDDLAPVARHVPALEMALEDLGLRRALDLARDYEGPPVVRLALAFMRAAADPAEDVMALARAASATIDRLLAQPGGRGRLDAVFKYIVLARPDVDATALAAELERHVSPEAGEVMKSAAERLIDEGLQKGLQQGVAQMLLLQLEERFGALDVATRQRIESASEAELKTWAKRVLTATRIEDVLGEKRAGRRSKKR